MQISDEHPPPALVYAQISPKSVGRQPLLTSPNNISAETVQGFISDTDASAEAARVLRGAGFQVLQENPLLLNISGTIEQYERFFNTELVTRGEPVRKPGQRNDVATFIDTLDNDIPGYLDASRSPLSGVIEGGALETARYPMQASAMPPKPGYWHLDVPRDVSRMLNAEQAHMSGITGKGVRVVMVDSGWYAHPWFAANGYRGKVVLGPGTNDPTSDTNGHGTGESANVFSVAPGVDFTMVKTNFANTTGAFNTAAALNPRPDVISCSWGSDIETGPLSPIDRALAASIALAVADGIIVIFSAGNGHFGFPGQHPDVISAGGVYVAPDGSRRASDYSSGFASRVYPGRNVPDLSGLVGMQPKAMYLMLPLEPESSIDLGNSGGTFPQGDETRTDDGWAAFSGTSAAAPQIAGACALLRQVDRDLTPASARSVLMDTAVDVVVGSSNPVTGGTVAGFGYDLATGAGLLDAGAAVVALNGTRPVELTSVLAGLLLDD